MKENTSAKQPLPSPKKILVIGNGGRENSLAWALTKSSNIESVWIAPGNGGTKTIPGCRQIAVNEEDFVQLLKISKEKKVDLVVIGPEAPLAAGLADQFRSEGFAVFGPGLEGSRLEASKAWAKSFMLEAGIPTAKYWTASNEAEALEVLTQQNIPLVVKADGLAAGKGVTVAETVKETKEAISEAFKGKFGIAGAQIVLEERLEGPEVSVFALCDGKKILLLPPAQDHKRLLEMDKGPNTGGMGAYAPAPLLSKEDLELIKKSILDKTLTNLRKMRIDFRGVIYAGLMLTKSGPKVIEYNCRFGDPECQTLMPLMGPQLAEVLNACALGSLDKAPELEISTSCSACVVAAASGYPESPQKGDIININLEESNQRQVFHAGTICNAEGKYLTSGGRVLAVVAQGDDFDEAFKNAYQGLEQIDFKGMKYRKDIGHQVRQL